VFTVKVRRLTPPIMNKNAGVFKAVKTQPAELPFMPVKVPGIFAGQV
jgi:hypothetical protein